jgi:hypothetical protein
MVNFKNVKRLGIYKCQDVFQVREISPYNKEVLGNFPCKSENFPRMMANMAKFED